MDFSWPTFIVEIVNFAVLVWILTRFLYQPVMRTIAARQAAIAERIQEATDRTAAAEELSKRYDARLAEWEREKAELREGFERELVAERGRREAEMQTSLERDRDRVLEAQRAAAGEMRRRLQAQADAGAARFGARLLERVASPEVESRLIEAGLEDLRALSEPERAALARSFDGQARAKIFSRYPIPQAQREALVEALGQCLGRTPEVTFEQDDALVAGIRIDLNTASLEGNIARELRWFAESERDDAG